MQTTFFDWAAMVGDTNVEAEKLQAAI